MSPTIDESSQIAESQQQKCERIAAIKQVLTEDFPEDVYLEIQNFEVYDDDVWVVTVPKAGTHWMQETLCCLLHGMDFEKLRSANYKRAGIIELPAIKTFDAVTSGDLAKFTANLERPRVMTTHLSWDNLPRRLRDPNCKAKIVYVTRNPKDVCVSRFYYAQMVPRSAIDRTKTFENYADEFLKGNLFMLPYWSHVFNFWIRRDSPKVLFVKYEEMKADFSKVLDRLQVFLGLDPLTLQQKAAVTEYLSFENMKQNKSVMDFMHCEGKVYRRTYSNTGGQANFMRQGKVGGWKQEMSPEMIQKFDDWTLENTAGTGYTIDAE